MVLGEAKQNAERLRAEITKEMERWKTPFSTDEAQISTEVSKLQAHRIQRAPADQLKWMRMKPRLCHDNASWMEENDPE